MKCLAGFPFEKPCIGGVNTYNQNNNEQESHIESTAGKSVFGHSGKCLDTFPDTVCHVIDEVQLIRLLHHISCGIAKIQADCPDKICDTVKPVLHRFSNAVQPVPRKPRPAIVHVEIKLIVGKRIL